MIIDPKKQPTKRDVIVFAFTLVLFFGALGGLALWRPDALIGAASFMTVAWLISLMFNREERRLQWLGLFLPLLFFVIGVPALAMENPLSVAIATWVVGVAVAAVVWGWPKIGRLAYSGWMLAAFPIGWTVSHLILAATFYLVFTPIGLTMRLFGWDPMDRKLDPAASTYWVKHKPPANQSRYFQQF